MGWAMSDLARVLQEAGGVDAPRERGAQLRSLLVAELARGGRELAQPRSGYGSPVTVAVAAVGPSLVGVAPVGPALRADPEAVPERAWLLVAALVGALVEAAAASEPLMGAWEGSLALQPSAADAAAVELVPVAFEEHVREVDRLRAHALAVPGHVLADAAGFGEPIGAAHPLRVAFRVASLGGRPADPVSLAEHEDAVLAAMDDGAVARPHQDPDPGRRVARRILQRLNGMGKWGGYHTEFAHLARGFAGNERALAEVVGERLLAAGLLAEKPSVGQRHVFLNPRRAADIHALIDHGTVPPDLDLPQKP